MIINKSTCRCSICHKQSETIHYELPVFGSEGINICMLCQREVTNMIHNLAMQKLNERKQEFLTNRKK